jgi:hypothetical protein
LSLLKKDGLAYSDSKRKTELLNDHFTSVFTKEDLAQRPTLPQSRLSSLNTTQVTTLEVFSSLQAHKAPGPEKIPARLFKLDSAELSTGLATFSQLSLDQGQISLDWKTALVTPVF